MAIAIETDEEVLESMDLKALKEQFVSQKHRVNHTEGLKDFAKLFSKVVKGPNPPKRDEAAHQRERERMISILKIALEYMLGARLGTEPPKSLFDGLYRLE